MGNGGWRRKEEKKKRCKVLGSGVDGRNIIRPAGYIPGDEDAVQRKVSDAFGAPIACADL